MSQGKELWSTVFIKCSYIMLYYYNLYRYFYGFLLRSWFMKEHQTWKLTLKIAIQGNHLSRLHGP